MVYSRMDPLWGTVLVLNPVSLWTTFALFNSLCLSSLDSVGCLVDKWLASFFNGFVSHNGHSLYLLLGTCQVWETVKIQPHLT